MSEATDVWLLAVALHGESTFWLCEPTNLKPLAGDWKSTNCRWLYPVEENVSRFADLSGFASTDAVYEVEWAGVSKVFRAATLTWNVKAKRQKMGRTTYVFVPAEDMKILDEAYSKFAKIEAMKPPAPRSLPASSTTDITAVPTVKREAGVDGVERAITPTAESSQADAEGQPSSASHIPIKVEAEDEDGHVKASHSVDGQDEGGSVVSSPVTRQSRSKPSHRQSSYGYPSHKRVTPHQGTTTYTAPVSSKPMGNHRSGEAFDWPEMFIVHRGSVDYLCPKVTNNSYGFRLDRVMHNGIPVFLLFDSPLNNSESVDSNARGVAVFEKAKLSGEGGEGTTRSSFLVLTRLSYKTDRVHRRSNHEPAERRRHRRKVSEDDTTTDEDEEEVSDEDDESASSDDDYVGEEEDEFNGVDDDDKPLFHAFSQRSKARSSATPPTKKPKVDPVSIAEEELETSTRRRGRKPPAAEDKAPLQAVNVNFWSEPHGVVPAMSQLAREFAFNVDGADTPQTAVFADGVCVTYTAATAAKHAAPEKKRKVPKHSHSAASTEDADLSMLNEHILNAFAQVRREGA